MHAAALSTWFSFGGLIGSPAAWSNSSQPWRSSVASVSILYRPKRRSITSTAIGKAMFTIIAAMAELERNVIRERVQAGLAFARKNGTKSGKAIGRPKAVFDRAKVSALFAEGLSLRQIAGRLGVGAT